MRARRLRLRYVPGVTISGKNYGTGTYGEGTYGQQTSDPLSAVAYRLVPLPAGGPTDPSWIYRRGGSWLPFQALIVTDDGLLDLAAVADARLVLTPVDGGAPLGGSPPVPFVNGYLDTWVGNVSTPDTADMAVTGPIRVSYKMRVDNLATSPSTFPVVVSKVAAGADGREFHLFFNRTNGASAFSVYSSAAGNNPQVNMWGTVPLGSDVTDSVSVALGSVNGFVVLNGAAPITRNFAAVPSFTNTTAPVVVGPATNGQWRGRIYWMQMETLDGPNGNPTGLVWRFDANDYPGTGTSYVDPRGRTWTLAAGAIVPKVPAVPAKPGFALTINGSVVERDWAPGDLSTVGVYRTTVLMTAQSGRRLTVPTDDQARFHVVESPT